MQTTNKTFHLSRKISMKIYMNVFSRRVIFSTKVIYEIMLQVVILKYQFCRVHTVLLNEGTFSF